MALSEMDDLKQQVNKLSQQLQQVQEELLQMQQKLNESNRTIVPPKMPVPAASSVQTGKKNVASPAFG